MLQSLVLICTPSNPSMASYATAFHHHNFQILPVNHRKSRWEQLQLSFSLCKLISQDNGVAIASQNVVYGYYVTENF